MTQSQDSRPRIRVPAAKDQSSGKILVHLGPRNAWWWSLWGPGIQFWYVLAHNNHWLQCNKQIKKRRGKNVSN